MNEHKPQSEVNTRTPKDIADEFMSYRQAGTGVSATLILLSSGVMAWVYGSRFLLSPVTKLFFIVSIVTLGGAILSALLIQFFHYKGYFNHARIVIKQADYHKKAEYYFNLADWAMNFALIFFIAGSISSAIFWVLDSKYSG